MKPFQLRDKKTGKLRYGGQWLVSFKAPGGKYRRQVGGASKKEAESTLRAILTDIERGVWVDPRAAKREAEASEYRTLGDICDAFAKSYASRSEGARKNLAHARRHLEGAKGAAPLLPLSTPLAELTAAKLRRVRDGIDAKALSTATKNIMLTYVKMIFRWAYKHPSIPLSENLAEGLERYRERGTRGGDGMTRTITRDEVFSPSEAASMVEYAFAHFEEVTAHMIQTAFLTGLRKGELAGLKWCDVDLEKRVVLVCRNYSRPGTKSGESRTVPLPAELVQALRKWKAASPYSKETEPVFSDADGAHRKESYNWSDMVREAARGAGCAREGMRRWGHMTRHTYATAWLLAGGSDTLLARWLGHRDTALIHRVYSHFCDFDYVAAMDRVGLTLKPKSEPIAVLPTAVSSDTDTAPEQAIS